MNTGLTLRTAHIIGWDRGRAGRRDPRLQNSADIVDDVAYPLPVTAICDLLGVPMEDQPRFGTGPTQVVAAFDPTTGTFEERTRRRAQVTLSLAST